MIPFEKKPGPAMTPPNEQPFPSISFIIPFYNCSRFLDRAISSVLVQRNPQVKGELILVNDGSTDDSVKVARRAPGGWPVRLIDQDNRGPGAARNRGARHARGDYLWFLDCDDELLPDALARVAGFLSERPDTDMVVGGHYTADEGGRKLHLPPPLPGDAETNFRAFLHKRLGSFAHGAVVVRRRVFDHLGYPEEIRNNEDLVLHAQILARYRCATLREPLVVVHRRPDSLRNETGGEDLPERITRLLFDPRRLPPSLLPLEEEFLASRRLSRFRRLYRAGRYREARALYARTVREHPASLLKWSYLRKYLRARLR